jgi:1-acylglycerone phosphate reductase
LCNRHIRCEEFARQGCKVYATSRRTETIADFSNESIEKLALDVTSDESVDKALNSILEKEGKIDVVVNNAGVSSPGNLFSNRSGQYSTKFLSL